MVFSWSRCPFCLRAKEVLGSEELGIKRMKVVELDGDLDVDAETGKAIRAELGKRTGRTSVPSVWVGGQFVGGCNDGGLGGVIPLLRAGALQKMLREAGALAESNSLSRGGAKKGLFGLF
uniref:Glutaredoxin domain-containing protein n=1 Tax=Chromera velia CCMP2878 TaxID=1169474 RepID=A0A0K6S8N2_9ALVE|eukprot:Cvel_26457.t1-p1 / transcript=Cvel_26457.t1 / gene=Cvel_26457 / organism=Chromera_velia_CCMP2878 / gene_product=Glutaredoxin-C2, putative / transcript_product=Glutaredoxin-C2, putative / location=Cvel_scaffold3147:1867-2223(+) / protein_length=119 / sequence_SO=supercontig / SO=protein_coding / is_pseudo=false